LVIISSNPGVVQKIVLFILLQNYDYESDP